MMLAILSALKEEQAGLSDLLSNKELLTYAGRRFVTGFIHKQPVVLALSGIGKVAAATTATALIERYGAKRIVFTGVAGGLGEGVQVGDVVLGTHYVQHDMDASPLFPRFEVPLYGAAHFTAHADLIATLSIAAHAHLETLSSQLDPKNSNPHRPRRLAVHHGLIASGDRFVSSVREAQTLCAALPAALCVEMEGAAVAQVCHDYAIPFAALRTISDRADDQAHVDFPAFVREVAGPYALGILRLWLQAQFNPSPVHA
jgi:adenosylhomocysteine nucleosidase